MGYSALRYAADGNHPEMVRLLLKNGADCNIISEVRLKLLLLLLLSIVKIICYYFLFELLLSNQRGKLLN